MSSIPSSPTQSFDKAVNAPRAQVAGAANPLYFGAARKTEPKADQTSFSAQNDAEAAPPRTRGEVVKTLLKHYAQNNLKSNLVLGTIVGTVLGAIFPPAIVATVPVTIGTLMAINLGTLLSVALFSNPNGEQINALYEKLGLNASPEEQAGDAVSVNSDADSPTETAPSEAAVSVESPASSRSTAPSTMPANGDAAAEDADDDIRIERPASTTPIVKEVTPQSQPVSKTQPPESSASQDSAASLPPGGDDDIAFERPVGFVPPSTTKPPQAPKKKATASRPKPKPKAKPNNKPSAKETPASDAAKPSGHTENLSGHTEKPSGHTEKPSGETSSSAPSSDTDKSA